MIRLRSANGRLKGLILLAITGGSRTTSEISYRVGEPLDVVRAHLIRMHHLHLVEPIGVRYDEQCDMRRAPMGAMSYFDDLLWDMTDHAVKHNESVEGCYGCALRELMPGLAEIGLVE